MRLRRSDVSGRGLTRRRHGRGFRYVDQDGGPVGDADRARIKALVIPPAWREVWICPWPNGHIQAVGVDDAGRRQYLYHEQWRRQRDEQKYDRVLDLAPRLPDFRKQVAADLASRGYARRRVLAVALRMLDNGVFRTGGDEYVEQNGTYGVATLLCDHVRVRGDRVSFDYQAKGGAHRSLALSDPLLAKAVAGLARRGAAAGRLLVCRDRTGSCAIHADDVNERFRELVGPEFSVKDLRTWTATVLAATILAGTGVPGSKRGRAGAVTRMYREVAEHLGNTPAVAKKSYVDPRLVELYNQSGTTVDRRLGAAELSQADARERVERATHELLSTDG
ncbi:MAG TPA: DNA topoisomerase IB [Pseudonocardiaceae bacterium]|nr:DNA topoisomerase IB [Pseudonocardiaceae bacterium]